jgi:hypothetical protein
MTKHIMSIAALETVGHMELTLVEGGVYLLDCPPFPGDDPTWGGVLPPPTFPRPIFC